MITSIKIIFLTALLLQSNKVTLSIPSIGDIQEIANFANDAWGVLNGELPFSALLTGSTGVMLDKILDAVGKISEKLDKVIEIANGNTKKLNRMHNLIEKLMSELPRQAKLSGLTREFNAYIDRIDFFYDRFIYYSADRENFNKKTISQYIDGLVSYKSGDLSNVFHRLHNLFVAQNRFSHDTLLYMLASPTAAENNICGTTISAQMRIYNIYKVLVVTEIRSLIMTIFGYSIMTTYKNETYYAELQDAKDQLLIRSKSLIQSFKRAMKKVPRVVKNCDLANYEEDVTHVKFSKGLSEKDDVGHALCTRIVKTDVKNNMVATGVRFVKENDLIYLQLKEAKLLPQGNVDVSTERWIPLPEMESKLDVDGTKRYYMPGSDKPLTDPYIFVLNNANRSLYLDQIILPPDTIMTAIDWVLTPGHTLYFEIGGTPFDYESGKLGTSFEWYGFYSKSNRPIRAYLRLDANKDPVVAEKRRMINDYVWMKFSSLPDNTIAPYFDTRTLQLNPRGPLAGVNLGLRIGEEDAGILNFEIHSIDYSKYMNSTM